MISKYSVRKPYTVLVAVVLVIVLGVVSLMKMTTDLLPDMSFQYALIITTDMGASPEAIESGVTAPIEAAMATTSNIKNITSTSNNSYSMVICEYEQSANMDSVVIEIQQKLDQLEGSFADSVGAPMIMQINPDMLPIMIAAVDMDDMSQTEIANYVNNTLIPTLESVEGVASVSASGAIEESIEITLNQEKIDALNEKLAGSIEDKFKDAEKEIKSGQKKIEDGKKAITDGKDELVNQSKEASAKINSGKDELLAQKASIQSQISNYDTAKTMYADKLQDIYDGATAAQAGASVLENFIVDETDPTYGGDPTAIETAKNVKYAAFQMVLQTPAMSAYASQFSFSNYDELKLAYDQMIAGIAQADAGTRMIAAALSDYGVSGSSYTDIPTMQATFNNAYSTAKPLLESGLAQINALLETTNSGSTQLETSKIEAIVQMSNGYADLVNAASQLETGKQQLEDAKTSALDSADLTKVLTQDTVSKLLVAQNFDMPAGYAYDANGGEFLVKVGESVKDIDELKDLVLMDFGTDEVGIVRLQDVADIKLADNSDESYAIINGNPGVMLQFEKQSGYSTGDVTDRILDKFKSVESENSKLHMSVLMNQGIYIDMVVKSVFQNMIFGAILAIFVLLLFLKDIKPTIIIACSIPLSVITAVVLMYFTGITMNTISMSGLVLGIGMLVDNSIVVIENIYRLRNEGYSIKKAAVEGASQVTGAIIASTLTTVSVYAPIIFTEGITRQLFVDLALTIAFTLAASLIVALTLVPAMSAAMLKNTKEIKHTTFDKFRDWYGKALAVSLDHKAIVFIMSIVLLAGSAALCFSRGMDFMNMEMETNQMSVTLSAKKDQKLEFSEMVELSEQAADIISEIDGVDTVGSMIGGTSTLSMLGGSSNDVSMYILLDEESNVDLKTVAAEIEDKTAGLNCEIEIQTNMMDMSAMLASGLSINIKGRDIDTLQSLTEQVAAIVNETEGVIDVDDGLDNQANEYRITVDKEKAAEYGYTVAQVFQMVYGEMAQTSSATTLSTDIKDYDVYVQTEVQSDTKLSDIDGITFEHTNDDGEIEEISISEIAKLEKTTTLSKIKRESQTRYLTVSAGVDDDHNVTLVANEIQEKIDKIDVPEGYSITMAGEDEQIMDAMKNMVLMLILAVIFIYLIMVAQFQSLLNPFIIMFSIPLAFTGGFLAIFLSGTTISVISMLGFVMLAGLIVNNGIVLIDYINQARREGMSKREAIIDSGKTRMRPILMTAMTTILAMSTSAVGMGEGSEMMMPMAISIIGGLVYGTVLTLVVIPCLYDAFNKEKSMVEEEL